VPWYGKSNQHEKTLAYRKPDELSDAEDTQHHRRQEETNHPAHAAGKNNALWRTQEKHFRRQPEMLTQQLRELEADGIITRKVYPEVPPRTEYSLTEKGATLKPVLYGLYEWGELRGEQKKQE